MPRRFKARVLLSTALFAATVGWPTKAVALAQAWAAEHTSEGSGVRPKVPRSEWSWPSSGYTDTAIRLTIEGGPSGTTPGASYFWAYQFGFDNGDGGYVGLQDGSDPSGEKIAIFSIWQANAVEPFSGGSCNWFDESGVGLSCRIDPYNWIPEREYRLRVAQDGSDSGGTWYRATVLDVATLSSTTIGRIRVPPAWGGLRGLESWTEYFGPRPPACNNLPRSRVRWRDPVANGGTVQITGHNHDLVDPSGQCPSEIQDLVIDGAHFDRQVSPK